MCQRRAGTDWRFKHPVVLAILLAATPAASVTGQVATPEEFRDLLLTLAEQAVSGDIEWTTTSARREGEATVPVYESAFVARWTPMRQYSLGEHVDYDPGSGEPARSAREIAIARDHSRLLRTELVGESGEWARGEALRGRGLEDSLEHTPYEAAYLPLVGPSTLARISNQNASVNVDGETGLLELVADFGEGAPVYRQVVDPSRGFVTMEASLTPKDSGRSGMSISFDEYRQTDQGQWLPTAYTHVVGDVETTTVVGNASLNEPIPDEKLDFEFPDGTRVFDHVANISYLVEGATPRIIGSIDESVEFDDASPAQIALSDPGLVGQIHNDEVSGSMVDPEDVLGASARSDEELSRYTGDAVTQPDSIGDSGSWFSRLVGPSFFAAGCFGTLAAIWVGSVVIGKRGNGG